MITNFLATVIGWYMVIFSFLILFRHEYIKSVVVEIMKQRGLFFILAIITFILGLLMVASHNIWVMGWPVIVTLFGWLVLMSGLIRLFFPDIAHKMAIPFVNNATKMHCFAAIILLIGLYFLFKVYI